VTGTASAMASEKTRNADKRKVLPT
jgi:hypothetical protein